MPWLVVPAIHIQAEVAPSARQQGLRRSMSGGQLDRTSVHAQLQRSWETSMDMRCYLQDQVHLLLKEVSKLKRSSCRSDLLGGPCRCCCCK
eukprot:s2614_g13.t1